jgi:D-alanine-D-alanine ligase
MSHQNKIRVAVLFGGRSGEHEVSLLSATNVIQYLDRSRFEVIPIGIDKQGVWFLGDDVLRKELNAPATLELLRDSERMLFNPDGIGRNLQAIQASQLIPQFKNSERLFDVIFPVIHGTLCEDGTVQGLLELAEIPYVGCGVLASAVGMDKDVAKRLIMNAGMRTAPYVAIKRGQWDKKSDHFCDLVAAQLTYPVFVKPSNAGSSLGVEKIKTPADLHDAINRAFQYDTKVLVEQGINAREIEVAVLESLELGHDPIVSVAGEIRPTHEFYSYEAKYLDQDGAELLIPAAMSLDMQEKAREFAKNIFEILECEGMARVDLFLDKDTNEFYFNEINTIPGFTQISMYPKLMSASGVEYSELLTHLIMLALQRHERKSELCREYTA